MRKRKPLVKSLRANVLLVLKDMCRIEEPQSFASFVSVADEGHMCRMILLHHHSIEVLGLRHQRRVQRQQNLHAAPAPQILQPDSDVFAG